MGISCFSKEIHLYLFTWILIAMLQKRTFHTWSPIWTRLKNKYRESSCKQNTPHPNFHVWFEVLEAYSHGNRAVDRMVFPVTIIQWSSDRIQYWFITIPQLHVQQLVIHSNGTAVFRSLATVPGLKFYHMQIVKTWQISLWVPRDSDHGKLPVDRPEHQALRTANQARACTNQFGLSWAALFFGQNHVTKKGGEFSCC